MDKYHAEIAGLQKLYKEKQRRDESSHTGENVLLMGTVSMSVLHFNTKGKDLLT